MTTLDLVVGRPFARRERWERLLRWADLIRVLSVKNFRQRYLRSRLGILWALLQPTLQAIVLTIVFVHVFKVKIPHYTVFVLSGIMSWQFFQQMCMQGTTSLVDNGPLVRKVAVPKAIFPLSAIGGTLLVYILQLSVLFAFAIAAGTLGWATFLLLLSIPLEVGIGAAIAILCCSIHVAVRDVRFMIDSGLLMFFYLTPVIYPITRIPDNARAIMEWNPMYGVLSLVRAAMVAQPVDWHGVFSATVCAVVIAVVGIWLFRRRSPDVADLV